MVRNPGGDDLHVCHFQREFPIEIPVCYTLLAKKTCSKVAWLNQRLSQPLTTVFFGQQSRLSLPSWSLSQAFLIALTSDFIPRMYYLIVESPIYNFEGYVNSTLAVFNTSDWGNPSNATGTERWYWHKNVEDKFLLTLRCEFRSITNCVLPPDGPPCISWTNSSHTVVFQITLVPIRELWGTWH